VVARAWCRGHVRNDPFRTPWRKMHLAIDPDMNIHAIEITGTDVSDSEGMAGSCQRTCPLIGSSPTGPTTAPSGERRLAIAASLP
ncbi:hypothetical protein, partial [Paraburkholderia aspalathi]|uniref:hypothetical protein n=1 Tax=Paraburkholderia aspalathi TaxID=1324617 RepID=UPI0038B866D9